jgi:mycofactocin precursor
MAPGVTISREALMPAPTILAEPTATPIPEPDPLVTGDLLPTSGPDPLVTDELLVEEISIDGMCGVY